MKVITASAAIATEVHATTFRTIVNCALVPSFVIVRQGAVIFAAREMAQLVAKVNFCIASMQSVSFLLYFDVMLNCSRTRFKTSAICGKFADTNASASFSLH